MIHASAGETNVRHMGSFLMVIQKDLDTITAIREVDAATDVTDEENPLIRR